MPPAGPFLSDEKGAKESTGKGDSDFPLPCTHPLKTAKEGELRFPLFGISPRLFYCQLTGGGALLRNGPAAPGQVVQAPSPGGTSK